VDETRLVSPANGPTQWAYEQACAALHRHRERADLLSHSIGTILAWRHLQPHPDAVHLAPLDAVLDSLSLDVAYGRHDRTQPSTLAEAVAAHREVMNARARALDAVRLAWDQIEAAAMREIDRHMPERAE
jgi:hypothetical protein